MSKVYVLVADQSRARLFAIPEPNLPLQEISDTAHPEGRMHEGDLVTDKPGNDSGSGGNDQRSLDPERSHKEHEANLFAKDLVEQLRKDYSQGKFEQLVLMAAPKFLGALRDSMDNNLKKAIIATVDKDLTSHSPDKIREEVPALNARE